MTWQNQIDLEHCDDVPPHGAPSHNSMTPGLTNTYDAALREKAGMHSPPPPPECMGREGEYDPCGLVHRLAETLDQQPDLAAIDTVTLTQHGSTICLAGSVEDSTTLDRLVDIASQLDGTRQVDVSQVSVTHLSLG
jgi:hypothetical protein